MTEIEPESDQPAECLWCSKPLGAMPRSAPHKKFCSTEHRNAWHAKQRAQVRELLQKQREGKVEIRWKEG